MCVNVINEQQGDMRLLRRCLKLLDVLEFSPAEMAEIGLVTEGGVTKWRETKRTWEVEINEEEATQLKIWLDKFTWRAVDAKWALALVEKF